MIIAMIVSKLIAYILNLLHHGATTLPGKIALKLKPNILYTLSKKVKVICVTGTNGKTTTCALLDTAFRANGLSYFANSSGANMLTGVVTSFIANSTILGKCKKDYAILECDENSLPIIASYIDAEMLVVTNLFRDQLDRYGEISTTLSKIQQGVSLMPDTKLVINADCPITSTLLNDNSVTFGMNITADSMAISDNIYCPRCRGRLIYSSNTYAHLGNYFCSRCGYKRAKLDYIISLLHDNEIIINDKLCKISLDGIYNAYNFLSAYAVCSELRLSNLNSLSSFFGAFGRMERFIYNDRSILVLLVKNPVGYSNCISLVSKKYSLFDMIFALNDKSADGCDVSWIWDVDYTPLSPMICDAYTIGTRAYDMAVKLKYDGIASNVLIGEDYESMVDLIKNGDKDFVIFSTYTSMMSMRHYLINAFGGEEFWR